MLDIEKLKERIDKISLNLPEEKVSYVIPANDDKPRKYLGASVLGAECSRQVWYQFRHCGLPKFSPRMKRLFRRGDREEFVFIWLLELAGVTCYTVDEEGNQFRVTDFEGHFSGHVDGVGVVELDLWIGQEPLPFLLEFKTYNSKRFAELKKSGVAISDPKYYAQMQLYMGYLELQGALFCAVCKDGDELYFRWIAFSQVAFNRLVSKAEDILSAEKPPNRMRYAGASSWKCKFCDFLEICFKNAPSLKSCRSCKFSYPGPEKTWACSKGREFGVVCEQYQDITKQ